MNKKELLKTLEEWKEFRKSKNHELQYYQLAEVIHLVKQLDEPQKVKVPEFVAEWIETAKKEKRTLHYSMQDIDDACYYHKGDDPLYQWMFVCGDSSEHQETFARAYMDGYEVEEEPKYYVQLPFLEWNEEAAELDQTELYLGFDITSDETRFMMSKQGWREFKTKLDEETIKSIDERYWPFAEWGMKNE